MRLANYAPKETKDLVEQMVANKNKYIDYEGVYEYLAARDYTEKFDPRDFMLEGLILRDIHTNGGL